jgi:hypothetical protein
MRFRRLAAHVLAMSLLAACGACGGDAGPPSPSPLSSDDAGPSRDGSSPPSVDAAGTVHPPYNPGGAVQVLDGGPVCVDVNLAAFDRSCATASDCRSITAGEICSDACVCPNAVISANGMAAYEQTIAPLQRGVQLSRQAVCGCPPQNAPLCAQGLCELGFGSPLDDAGVP